MDQRNKLAERIALGLILAVFCFRVASIHPREFFGFFQDDTIYFSTAKALAAGQGYVLPSFPGVLPQTKYPILYPLILSLVWSIQPTFPANLTLAIAVSVAIAAAYLLLSYVFIRRSGASPVISVCVLAAIAMHPELEWFAGVLLSDYLFALLVVASVLAADEAWLNSERSVRWGIAAGLLLGFSMLARSAGIGVIIGIAVYGALQRRWRMLAVILAVCIAVVGMGVVILHALYPVPVAAGSGTPPTAFEHVATYNSSYARFWLLSVPTLSVLGAMLWTNLRLLLEAPGFYFVMPGVLLPSNVFTFALAVLVTVFSVMGIVRFYRLSARRTMVFAALGSLPILLLWNYVIYDRFLLPFVPLIFLGVATELRRMLLMLAESVCQGSWSNRILAGTIAAIPIGLIGVGAYNYVCVARGIKALSESEAALNDQRHKAYGVISHDTFASGRIIAYADALTYLYTGRQSVRPFEVTTDCRYEPEQEKCVLNPDQLIASVRYVGAIYWITTPNDYGLEGTLGKELRRRIVADLQGRIKPIFVSTDGTIVVYDTTCLVDPKNANCSNIGTY